LCAGKHVFAAEDGLVLIADDKIQELLNNSALLFSVSLEEECSGHGFLVVMVSEVETLFFFKNIVQLILVLAGIRFELG